MDTYKEFTYIGETTEGAEVKEVVKAQDRYAVYDIARERGHTIHKINEVRAFSLKKIFDIDRINRFLSRIKDDDVVMVTRNLSAMIKAGLPLSRALSVSERQTRNPRFKHVLKKVRESIGTGSSLYEALKAFPGTFSPLYIAMVRAGEESGKLSEALGTISIQMERSSNLKKKIRGAMVYPIIVIGAMIIIGVLMMIFVVPTLIDTFSELNVELPTATKIIIGISEALSNNTLVVLGGTLLFFVGVVMLARSALGKRAFGFVLVRLPVIGAMAKETYSARTARTLSSLLSSGVDVVNAMSITEDIVQHYAYRKIVREAAEKVEKGGALSETFKAHEKLYPILFSEMVAVGEETGQISDMLREIAEFYEGEIERKTKDLSTIIEPILMVVIGGVVGFFALAMIAPIYSISDSIG